MRRPRRRPPERASNARAAASAPRSLSVKARRAARIRELKQAVAQGTYHVADHQLAEAIVRRALLHRELHAKLTDRARPDTPPG